MNLLSRSQYYYNNIDEAYAFARRNIGPYDLYDAAWMNPIPDSFWGIQNKDLKKLTVWINRNISLKTDLISLSTENVLIRIATGMLNNISVLPADIRIKLHINLTNNRKAARQEWNVYALKNSKGLPF